MIPKRFIFIEEHGIHPKGDTFYFDYANTINSQILNYISLYTKKYISVRKDTLKFFIENNIVQVF